MSDWRKMNQVQELMKQKLEQLTIERQEKLHDPYTANSYFMNPTTLEELRNHPELKDAMRVLGNGINFHETTAVPPGEAYVVPKTLEDFHRIANVETQPVALTSMPKKPTHISILARNGTELVLPVHNLYLYKEGGSFYVDILGSDEHWRQDEISYDEYNRVKALVTK